ncbi:ABC transporter permease subunit [Paenibacillus oryzisoli]|uniref:ABC transporter permease n=1 Tax=Paenibacillus oryzisoli TaxID=1850517 RepID=UPI003D27F143
MTKGRNHLHNPSVPQASSSVRSRPSPLLRSIRKNWDLYLLISPVILYFLLFEYFPMYGVQIAFKNFVAVKGIWGSPWIGLDHFVRFFHSYYFDRLIRNTIETSLYTMLVGFPAPLLLALMINEIRSKWFRRMVQTITYAPHFLSTVVVVGMIIMLLSTQKGVINHLIVWLGGKPIAFMTDPAWFKTVYVFSGAWQSMGWGSIIYLAALAGVDPQLHEAAIMDGASRLKRIYHINIPAIMPTIVVLLILNMGHVMSVGFEKIYLMQNDLNLEASDVIATYVYRSGIIGAQYSLSAAIGLFNSVVNFILLVVVNFTARKLNDTSLW